MGHEAIQRSQVMSDALELSSNIIYTLKETSKVAPVPFLSLASTLALSILETVQNARNNKDDFLRLGNDACNLVFAIGDSVKEVRNTNEGLLSHLNELVKTLSEIDTFAKGRAHRSKMHRALFTKGDAGAIQEYRQRLRHALDIFGVQTMISNTDVMSGIAEGIRNMNTKTQLQSQRAASTGPFSFSGSDISFSNTSFNNYDKDYHSTSTQDSSRRENYRNTYYQITNPGSRPMYHQTTSFSPEWNRRVGSPNYYAHEHSFEMSASQKNPQKFIDNSNLSLREKSRNPFEAYR
ncbi:hypothetical protein D9758_014207 [Tetrapyrgos nigripes]|uniref:Uncharacterized protein n=1 Tax=Tetrapyrgos nigripes TaxID=182062 RepID=A0A8H5CXK1_9AGAR|nr:hypothetical protein D9758_014207 [Tetrapyrgos nigripes]